MESRTKAAILALTLALGGCESLNELNEYLEKHQMEARLAFLGLFGGGIAGAELAGGAAAIGAGAAIGAAGGWGLGTLIEQGDVARFFGAMQKAATGPVSEPVPWRNPDTGTSGEVTPVGLVDIRESGQVCRDLAATLKAGATTRASARRVCRKEDGSWRVQG
ncbi:MAG: RT0821/Lpp0805 family surface protein [Alphaproteobacteria bacterium]|jgi:surface antigen|nr:RT0821/Lpp0805 family surface protein [Alphaproteobacteria bacterium]